MKRCLFSIILFVFIPTMLFSGYYYKDDFNTLDTTTWYTDFFMARDGRIDLYPADYGVDITAAGGTLNYTGDVYAANAYDGVWGGTGIIMSNQKFTASESIPIGAEIYITSWQILNNGPSPYADMADFGLWVVQDPLDSVTYYTSEYQNFTTKVMVFYTAKNENTPDNFWGIFVNGADNHLNMQNAIRPDGSTIDLSAFNGLTVKVSGNELVNTNISIKVAHTGSEVLAYFNPNPKNSNNNGYPDEFCLVGSYPVTFSQNIRFFINEEVRNKNSHCNPNFDYFLIKSAASSTSPTMTTGSVVTASTNAIDKRDFELRIQNTISATDSGINVITVTKPSTFDKWATSNLTNEIKVFTAYNGGGTLLSNIVRPFAQYSNLATNECAIKTNGNELWIRLGKQIDASFSQQDIVVKFQMVTSSNEGIYNFYTTVDGVLFDPVINNQTNYSTCGPMKSSTTVEVIGGDRTPYAFGSIDDDDGDNTIISGAPSYTFTYTIETIGVTNSDADTIQSVYIMIPTGFVLSSAESIVLVDDNTSAVSIVTNPSKVSTNGIFIKVNYSLDSPPKKIAAQDGIDIVKIVVSQATQIGTFSWPAWVEGSMGKVSQVLTNSSNPNQDITVIGANPDARAGIVQPSSGNPRILFNTIASNEIKIEIENQASDAANKINAAIITIPAFFTNINNVSSSIITNPANIKLYKAPLGNRSSITLFYANEGKYIAPSQSDIITFDSYHNIPGNSGSQTNDYFSVVVNNSNGAGYIPASTVGKVTNIMITDPIPSAAASINPQDEIVYTSDTNNIFEYKIVNSAPAGSGVNILFIDISIPTNYFTKVTNISSSLVGTTGITNFNNSTIKIDYTVAGTHLIPGQLDTITFMMVDKYTNIPVPGSVLVPSKVYNLTKTNNTTDYAPDNRYVYFVPQEAMARSWTINKNFLSENSTFTLYYAISNYNDTGNKISQARIYFTNTLIDIGVGNVTSQLVGSLQISYLAGPIIDIDYSTTNFDSGMKDVIQIVGDYLATGIENTYSIESRVTVNTSTLVPAKIKTNDNVNIYFEIPHPYADIYITPNVIFTSTTNIVDYLNLYITNKGTGGNSIVKSEVIPPDLLLGKVTIVSSSHIISDGTSITNNNRLILSYAADSSNLLAPGNIDWVTLAVTNSVTSITNVSFNVMLFNSDKSNLADEKTGKSKNLSIVEQSSISITPGTNYTTDITNIYRVKIQNGLTPGKGRNIYRARITINTQIFDTSYIYSYDHYAGAVPTTVTNGGVIYRYIDYSANPLTPGNVDDFYLKLVDKVVTTNSMKWVIEVDYNDGYGFRQTIPYSAGSDTLYFTIPPVEATASISPNQIAVNNIVTPLEYTINNTGYVGNNILLARIHIPNPDTIFTNVDTSSVSNLLGGNITFSTVGGNGHISQIIINYASSNTNIPAGGYDKIFFSVYDSVASGGTTKYQFICDAANTVDTNFTAPTTLLGVPEPILDAQKVQFSEANYDSDAYITSHSPSNPIDTTTTTNTITYYIYNSSLTASDKINKIRISIPTNYFVTNGIQVSSTTNPDITVTANSIEIDYTSAVPPTAIEKGLSDTITIKIVDKVYVGDVTNVKWQIYALFSTSVPNYIACVEPGGSQLQSVDFRMPAATADSYITPNAVLTVNEDNQFSLKVINKGTGSNKLYKVVLTIDTSIISNIYNVDSSIQAENTNNVRPAGVTTNDKYAAKNVSSFTLYYNAVGVSLNPGQTDTITFNALDKYVNNTVDTNIQFVCYVANESNKTSTNFYTTTIPVGKRMDVDFKHFPGYPYADNNVEAGFVDTEPTYNTNAEGNYIYRIKNNGPAGNNIEWAVIDVPENVFTNISSINSSLIGGAFIKADVSTITLYYKRAGITVPPGSYDDISFIGYHNISSNEKNDIVVGFPSYVKFQTNGTSFQTEDLNNVPLIQSVIIKRLRNDKALSYIDSIVKDIEGYSVETTFDIQAVTYLMDHNIVLKYKVVNQSADDDISVVKLTFDVPLSNNWFIVDNANVLSTKTTNITFGSNTIDLAYSNYIKSINGSTYESNRVDIISIPIHYNTSSETNITITGKYGLAPSGQADEDTETGEHTQTLYFKAANFGRVIGKVYPPNITVSPQVLDSDGNEVKTPWGTSIPKVYSDTNGIYILDYVQSGTWDVKLTAGNLTATSKNITVAVNDNVTFNENKNLNIDLKYIVQKEKTSKQKISSYDTGYTGSYLEVPTGDSLFENFAFNIRVNTLTEIQRQKVSEGNGAVKSASYSSTSNLVAFDFDVENLEGVDYTAGIELASESILTLQYDETKLPTNWKESELAIFYWDEKVQKWYRVGGIVNESQNTVSVNVRYLHRRYAVFAAKGNESNKVIFGVEVNNNPFTPDSSDSEYNHTIITFQLQKPASDLQLVIFNLKGEEIIRYSLDGSKLNGEQAWYGKDMNGNPVSGGIYIFQIIADDKDVYTGSILLVK